MLSLAAFKLTGNLSAPAVRVESHVAGTENKAVTNITTFISFRGPQAQDASYESVNTHTSKGSHHFGCPKSLKNWFLR